MKKVSILVPVYNVEKYLPKCLESLCSQTWQNLEIILVNDGSTDHSLQIAKAWQKQDSRIHIHSQRNQGISATRNKSLDLAAGDCFLFCDSDDYLEPNTVQTMMQEMEAQGSDIVQCGFIMEFGKLKWYRHQHKHQTKTALQSLHMLVANQGFNNYPWGKLYKRHVFDGVRFDPQYKGFEDTRTIFKTFMQAETCTLIPGCFVHYVQRNGSLTNRMSLDTVYDMRKAYQYQEQILRERYPQEKFDFNLNYYNSDMVIIYTLIVFSKRKEHPFFIPARLDWSSLPAIYKPAYRLWLDLACLKFGWDKPGQR